MNSIPVADLERDTVVFSVKGGPNRTIIFFATGRFLIIGGGNPTAYDPRLGMGGLAA